MLRCIMHEVALNLQHSLPKYRHTNNTYIPTIPLSIQSQYVIKIEAVARGVAFRLSNIVICPKYIYPSALFSSQPSEMSLLFDLQKEIPSKKLRRDIEDFIASSPTCSTDPRHGNN